jgi:NH3-dependent NAD+ synthetase
MGNLRSKHTDEEWEELSRAAEERAKEDMLRERVENMTKEEFVKLGISGGMDEKLAGELYDKSKKDE